MVYRGGSPGRQDDGHCMAVARRSPIWPIRESSPQRTPTFLLWRSRRTTGWVRAVPGAPPTAPASMDGPDGRTDGIPGVGKGLTLSSRERLAPSHAPSMSSPAPRPPSPLNVPTSVLPSQRPNAALFIPRWHAPCWSCWDRPRRTPLVRRSALHARTHAHPVNTALAVEARGLKSMDSVWYNLGRQQS